MIVCVFFHASGGRAIFPIRVPHHIPGIIPLKNETTKMAEEAKFDFLWYAIFFLVCFLLLLCFLGIYVFFGVRSCSGMRFLHGIRKDLTRPKG